MVKKYRFRTSLGYVVLTVDTDTFKVVPNSGGCIETKEFNVEEGKEFVDNRYTGGEVYSVDKAYDGTLFAIIKTDDDSINFPEYILESIGE